ncbi:DUF3889 domain-containing protein [Cohnella suwonensis]|uniref:DUF3889 domain-containing protein n=1 Tax=Cohnella suwonensis TaxID=696072 RepID=A0ABW0LZ60_9BACL
MVLPLLKVVVSVMIVCASGMPAKFDPNDGYREYIVWVPHARKAVGEAYPDAAAVDFQYVGCEARSPTITACKYKYWMKDAQGREFGVYVTVEGDNKSGRALSVRTEKTDS